MSKRDEQIARMQGLMTYGISNTPKKHTVSESVEGPDGKIYAIIREGAKFYIKSAPKGSELVTESFNYIGGFMNKKNNEFSSYNQASKNLEFKVRSLNEAYGVNKTVELLNPEKKESLMVEMTDAMKTSIARYRQIMNNSANIMNESATISASNTGVPEAPKTTSFSEKLGEPFNNTAKAELDKDLKATASDPEKQGEPFGDNSKAEEFKKAEYVPAGSVANQHPSGGKVVRVNENEEYEETIEECDEWGSCGVPTVGGVGEVGDDAPFTQSVNENNFFHNDDIADDEQLADVPDEVNLEEDTDDVVGFADEDTFDEGEEDIDLDDIDAPLDDEESIDDETDIDDIDSEDVLSDEEGEEPIDDVTSSEDADSLGDVEALRQEVEELRQLVNKLMGDSEPEEYDNEEPYELENDEEKDEEFDLEEEPIEESCSLDESNDAEELPFPVKVREDELTDMRGKYGMGLMLFNIVKENGNNKNDLEIVGLIRKYLYNMLTLDYHFRACVKNKYFDKAYWDTQCSALCGWLGDINTLLRDLSFYDQLKQDENFVLKLQMLTGMVDGYLDILDSINGLDTISESVNKRLNEEGTKLNVFGKHPGYRKKVMSLPQTGSDKEGNVRDWNDDSVYSEEPFGNKIGKSNPYEDVIEKSVNSIMESLKKKL